LSNPDKNSVLYIFPLNALAKDQEEKIRKLNASLPVAKQLRIFTITGELSREHRIQMFKQGPPHILITNPEILHHQLFKLLDAQWTNWREFISRLKYGISKKGNIH
jgi:DEAD/DEAH box helicase domain-containing protein